MAVPRGRGLKGSTAETLGTRVRVTLYSPVFDLDVVDAVLPVHLMRKPEAKN